MRSEQGRRERGKAGGCQWRGRLPNGQSFPSRLGFVFKQVRGGSFCFGASTASLPRAPIFYSQIRSLWRVGGVLGVEVLLQLEGGPVPQTWLSHLSLFPEPGYCQHLWILSQIFASPTLGVWCTSLPTSPWKQESLHPSQS